MEFTNTTNVENHDFNVQFMENWNNRGDWWELTEENGWGDDDDVFRRVEFGEMFLSELGESVGSCEEEDGKVNWGSLRGYMSYVSGVWLGEYHDTPESFSEYYDSHWTD